MNSLRFQNKGCFLLIYDSCTRLGDPALNGTESHGLTDKISDGSNVKGRRGGYQGWVRPSGARRRSGFPAEEGYCSNQKR
jgi:hypothetical protein